MARYVFHLQVADGQARRLRELNEQYSEALRRVTGTIPGLRGIGKYLLGDQYVEVVDFDGAFADFAAQLAADQEVRQFLRSVSGCFVQSLRDMAQREMPCLQAFPANPAAGRRPGPAPGGRPTAGHGRGVPGAWHTSSERTG
ncbi:MAG TPA: hypothetical protein VKV35_07940 [Streptosporangiaceae bacterium]|nr:hypothetical protein [Streptosporangiaceae bacterium]